MRNGEIPECFKRHDGFGAPWDAEGKREKWRHVPPGETGIGSCDPEKISRGRFAGARLIPGFGILLSAPREGGYHPESYILVSCERDRHLKGRDGRPGEASGAAWQAR